MRHARRLIATLIGCATWCVAATSVAYARLPDPEPVGSVVAPSQGAAPLVGDQWWNSAPSTSAAGTPLWEVIAVAALGVLMAVAVVGLIYSLRHQRRSGATQRPETSQRTHA